jgi:hypothetical protein
MLKKFVKKYPDITDFETYFAKEDLSFVIFLFKNDVLEMERLYAESALIQKLKNINDPEELRVIAKVIAKNSKDPQLLVTISLVNIVFAHYVIKYSKILNSLCIIQIVESYGDNISDLLCIVAKKRKMDEILTDYIIYKNNLKSIIKLINNERAEINDRSLLEVFKANLDNNKVYFKILSRIKMHTQSMHYLLMSVDEDLRERIVRNLIDEDKTLQIFLPNNALCQAFTFYIDMSQVYKLKHDLDQLLRIRALSPIIVAKYLLQGDAYSFCYAVSRVTNTSFNKVRDLFCSEYQSEIFLEVLGKVGFNDSLIGAIMRLIEFIYISSLEEFLTNKNFLQVIKKQYSLFISRYHSDSFRTIEYLFELAHE